ncbi:hypothetical protein PVAND_003544 [Polypedilum vanderplanki]|uniref:glutathione transferase n=1 Tax=Polypedilum vanderplanki TaxID=319348 RepID=A0A9J6BUD6_POLVA|nr:hypothetical protein PVAND_003544 [Polypedilum vanderplanki]
MSSKLVLYYLSGSMPSRACMLLARLLNLNFEIKQVNIPNNEQFNEDFVKLNPAKKIPVLVDGDYVLSESRAILAYLVNSRSPGSNLYPTDPKQRGIVDQRLYYDATVFLPNMLAVIRPIVVEKKTEISPTLQKPIEESLEMIERYLNEYEYVAASHLTIADISMLPSVTTAREFGFNLTKYPRLNKWHHKLETLPGFDENLYGSKTNAAYLRKMVNGPIFNF